MHHQSYSSIIPQKASGSFSLLYVQVSIFLTQAMITLTKPLQTSRKYVPVYYTNSMPTGCSAVLLKLTGVTVRAALNSNH